MLIFREGSAVLKFENLIYLCRWCYRPSYVHCPTDEYWDDDRYSIYMVYHFFDELPPEFTCTFGYQTATKYKLDDENDWYVPLSDMPWFDEELWDEDTSTRHCGRPSFPTLKTDTGRVVPTTVWVRPSWWLWPTPLGLWVMQFRITGRGFYILIQ